MINTNSNMENCKVFRPKISLEKCPVVYVWNLFVAQKFTHYKLLKVSNDNLETFPGIFKEQFSTGNLPERIFLFAHEVIPKWWKEEEISYEMLIAHVCKGADELNGDTDIPFKDWVSYSKNISIGFGHPKFDELWRRIFIGISNILNEPPQDSSMVKKKIKSIYENELRTLDEGEPMDDILIGCIATMDSSIVSKID